jgi:Protein of unknown function (DUF3072)
MYGYSSFMTENQANPSTSTPSQDTSAAAKNPEDWVTGEEPMTDAQASYLATLAQDTGREIPDSLTKAQASELIDELQAESPRVSG